MYVPRDEAFAEVKQLTFATKTLKSALHALLPQIEITFVNPELGFPYFTAIDSLFNEGITLPKPFTGGILQSIIPRLVEAISDSQDDLLLFETPEILDRMPPCPALLPL
jgi:lipoxygenase